MEGNTISGREDPHPIGIFDSGIGGLTVLRALLGQLPGEQYLYLGDTARVPYGSKSARTVARYTLQVADYLLAREVKALVVACNTASAMGLPALVETIPIPVVGVIEPGCKAALAASQTGRIGVIATRSTVASGAYASTLSQLDKRLRTISLPCPLFVPLVEEGWLDHAATRLIVADTLAPLQGQKIDTLILGCTHYPLLKPLIQEVMGDKVHLVDSAQAVAEELSAILGSRLFPAPARRKGGLQLMVTDTAERFREVAQRFLGGMALGEVLTVDL
ncbi:MAG: glutamate racemase [Magnetococcales bacterium]|nr:glutamate racemase [Magnetococcales bacterium]